MEDESQNLAQNNQIANCPVCKRKISLEKYKRIVCLLGIEGDKIASDLQYLFEGDCPYCN